MAAKVSKKQLALDFEEKPAEGGEKSEPTEKTEDFQVIVEFNLLSERQRISEALTDLTHFEGGQKPLYTDMEGVRENLYIKSTDIKEARKRLTELLGDKKIEIIESRNAFNGRPQLLIQKKKKPVEREQSKPVQEKSHDDGRDPGDVYWPEWQ